jgi:hypothetical protein
LENSEKDAYYLNFRERLRLFYVGAVGGYVILRDWVKADNDELRRRGYCAGLLDKYLARAKAENELKDYSAQLPLEKGWEEKWRVTISK